MFSALKCSKPPIPEVTILYWKMHIHPFQVLVEFWFQFNILVIAECHYFNHIRGKHMAVGKRGWFILVMKRGKPFLSNSIDVQYFGDMPLVLLLFPEESKLIATPYFIMSSQWKIYHHLLKFIDHQHLVLSVSPHQISGNTASLSNKIQCIYVFWHYLWCWRISETNYFHVNIECSSYLFEIIPAEVCILGEVSRQ